MKTVGRPALHDDDDKVYLCATGKTRLQRGSLRRAIVNALVDNGGAMTLAALDKSFGFSDIRATVFALERAGWLRIDSKSKGKAT